MSLAPAAPTGIIVFPISLLYCKSVPRQSHQLKSWRSCFHIRWNYLLKKRVWRMKCRGYSGHTIQTKALIPIARSCVIHGHSPISEQLAPIAVLWTKGAPLLSFKYSWDTRNANWEFLKQFWTSTSFSFSPFLTPSQWVISEKTPL